VESSHRVSAAVVDAAGRLLARSGDPALVTFWRSAAKPFQAMPMVEDGAADHFGFGLPELALACASHSSEPVHRDLAHGMLRKLRLSEEALACGPHPPLSPELAEQVIREGTRLTPVWSNCSGKHAGMLALALYNEWPTPGYQRLEHPVQERIVSEIERWTDVPADRLVLGVDGCTVVSFGLPLAAMALAYARFGVSTSPGAVRLREAMSGHPELIAGAGRLETELGRALGGRVIAKVGADGIYCASLPAAGLGLALKVEDGDMRAAGPALLAVLRDLASRAALGFDPATLPASVLRQARVPILNTRGAETGVLHVTGALRFLD